MAGDNPFWNVNNAPDSRAAAVAALAFWLLLAAMLWGLTPHPFNWIVAAGLAAHGVRTWLRFQGAPRRDAPGTGATPGTSGMDRASDRRLRPTRDD